MASKPNHIVLTTIFVPCVLEELRQHLALRGQLSSVVVWVVGDRKTPAACEELCRKVADEGLDTRYLSVAQQVGWGRDRCPELLSRFPINNESRRNIGYLHALADGCRRLISIDDDNFPTKDDLIGGHEVVGGHCSQTLITEPSGFHNICQHLQVEPHRAIHPRGFPFLLRGTENAGQERKSPHSARIGVNAGLWMREPDIDATTWLNGKVSAIGYSGPATTTLAQDTWTPINTQNTAVVRDLLPAFLCIPMGAELPGGRIERYGDIWAGYFLQAVMSGTRWHVAFGRPLLEHRRNPHNYLSDLRHEFYGMLLTDWLLTNLRERFDPGHGSITSRYHELADFVCRCAQDRLDPTLPSQVKDFLIQTARTMHLWADACEVLHGQPDQHNQETEQRNRFHQAA